MGSSESKKQPEKAYDEAVAQFSPQEIVSLKTNFAGFAQPGVDVIDPLKISIDFLQFQEKLGKNFPAELGERFFRMFVRFSCAAGRGSTAAIFFQGWAIGASHLLKGTALEKAEIFRELMSGNCSKEALLKILSDFCDLYVTIELESPEAATWSFSSTSAANTHDAANLSNSLALELPKEPTEIDALEKWITSSSLIGPMLRFVSYALFEFPEVHGAERQRQPTIPIVFSGGADAFVGLPSNFHSLFNIPSLYFLNQHLPHSSRFKWRLLYSSKIHGESFSKFQSAIEKQGPTVLLIRDDKNFIFGGYNSMDWCTAGQFFGNASSFLFTLHPKFSVFPATGYNENYCYLNTGQQTLPNGLGMGGLSEVDGHQVHYFGLWIGDEFSIGKSQNCTTFHNPQMAASEEFRIEAVEAWAVEPKAEIRTIKSAQSILDKDPAVKAMLEMTGRGLVSEGLRESDKTSHIPGEHSVHGGEN